MPPSLARQLLLLLGLALLPALAAAWLHPRRPDWHLLATRPTPLSVSEAKALAARGPVLWVDARSAERFSAAHIPGAMNLSEERWEEGLPGLVEHWQPGTPVLVYCDALDCQASTQVARRLAVELGIDQVHILTGGWPAWQEAKP